MTFNLSNLNYVKKRLFEPELVYLQTKFKEDYENLTSDLKAKMNKII